MKAFKILVLLMLCNLILLAQTDSVYQSKAGVADVADSDPGLFIVMMFLLIGFIVCFVIAIFLLAFICLVIFFLSFLGIVSVAALVSFYSRSIKKGLKTFFHLAFSALGILLGIISAIAIKFFWLHQYSVLQISVWSVIGGCFGGLIVSSLLFKLLNSLYIKYLRLLVS